MNAVRSDGTIPHTDIDPIMYSSIANGNRSVDYNETRSVIQCSSSSDTQRHNATASLIHKYGDCDHNHYTITTVVSIHNQVSLTYYNMERCKLISLMRLSINQIVFTVFDLLFPIAID